MTAPEPAHDGAEAPLDTWRPTAGEIVRLTRPLRVTTNVPADWSVTVHSVDGDLALVNVTTVTRRAVPLARLRPDTDGDAG